LCINVQGYDEFKAEQPLDTINTVLVTVKVGIGRKQRNHQFKLVTSQDQSFEFAAASSEDLKAWAEAIQNSTLWGLNQVSTAMHTIRHTHTHTQPHTFSHTP
jgi:hypothetical protein